MDSFVASVLLVLATGGVSLAIAWQQNRFARSRARAEREQQVADRQSDAARVHSERLLTALNEIVQVAMDARPTRPPLAGYSGALATARTTYLLVPDVAVRTAIADGLTVVAAAQARSVEPEDFQDAATLATFVLASYLRGDSPDEGQVARLRSIRAAYPSTSVPVWRSGDHQNGVSTP